MTESDRSHDQQWPRRRFLQAGVYAVPVLIGASSVALAGPAGATEPEDDGGSESSEVVVDGEETGVPNIQVDGTTLADLLDEAAASSDTHGDFASKVAHLTNELNGRGLLTGTQKGKLQSAVGISSIP